MSMPETVVDNVWAPEVGEPPGLSGAHVLIVDDEPAVSHVLAAMLDMCGYRARTIDTSSEALHLIDTRKFHLVISDLRLPDGDGMALYQQLLRRHESWRYRFILITGDDGGDGSLQPFSPPNIPCLYKPFPLPDLARLVDETLARADALDACA